MHLRTSAQEGVALFHSSIEGRPCTLRISLYTTVLWANEFKFKKTLRKVFYVREKNFCLRNSLSYILTNDW